MHAITGTQKGVQWRLTCGQTGQACQVGKLACAEIGKKEYDEFGEL